MYEYAIMVIFGVICQCHSDLTFTCPAPVGRLIYLANETGRNCLCDILFLQMSPLDPS